jgi:hypothetical protein
MITEDNVIQEVSSLLKTLRIPFSYEDDVFELMVGTETCHIQVEYVGGAGEEKSIVMQFYDDPDNSMYEECDDITDIDQVEVHVEQMVRFVKEKIKKVVKILNHINAIKAICEDLDVDYEKFIEVVYDFDGYE